MASDSLTIATSIGYSRTGLQQLNNFTYLFNPDWNPEGDSRVNGNTLPMALLHIIKMEEELKSQVSSQKMLLYADPSALGNSNLHQAQVSVVSDNIVNQPKQYKIECLLPRTYAAVMNSTFAAVPYDPITFMYDGYEDFKSGANGAIPSTLSVVSNVMGAFNTAVSVLKTLIGQLSNLAGISTDGIMSQVNMILNGTSYNKDSLEAMWLSRATLRFKTPYSWKYKTVCITDCNISKVGTENDVYRCNLVLSEVPMVTAGYYKAGGIDKASNSIIATSMGKTLGTILKKIGGNS